MTVLWLTRDISFAFSVLWAASDGCLDLFLDPTPLNEVLSMVFSNLKIPAFPAPSLILDASICSFQFLPSWAYFNQAFALATLLKLLLQSLSLTSTLLTNQLSELVLWARFDIFVYFFVSRYQSISVTLLPNRSFLFHFFLWLFFHQVADF